MVVNIFSYVATTYFCCCSVKAATANAKMSRPGRVPKSFNYRNRQWAGFGLWAIVCQPSSVVSVEK